MSELPVIQALCEKASRSGARVPLFSIKDNFALLLTVFQIDKYRIAFDKSNSACELNLIAAGDETVQAVRTA